MHEHQVGEIVKCKIVRVEENGLLVDFGFKTEGLIDPANIFMKSGDTLEKLFQVGGEIEATVISLEPRDGYVLLSKKQADIERAWAAAYDAFKNKKILEAQVISSVKGGLVVDFHRLRGFIPASQIFKEASSTGLEKLVGETLPIKVIEINRQQNKIIFSHRLAAEEVKKFSEEKIFSEVEVGQVRRGRVSSIKSFGVFVDLGGVEGLVHISELTLGRIKHPSEVVKIGDEVEVFILGINQDKKKISLGLRQLQPDTWVKARDLYRVGQIVRGKVVRLVKFGAFVELEKGLEGLLHLSEMKDPSPSRPEEAVKIGEEVQVKILRIVPEEQKIGLSLKAAQEEAAKEKAKESAVVEERKVTIGDLMKEKNIQLESVQPPATEAPEPPPQI